MKILYVIPARGGSKGLPGKNILPLLNMPVLAYTILAAKGSSYEGTVMVSTDDEAIAAVAGKYGAEVPFVRPAVLSGDKAASMDVVLHAIGYYRSVNKNFDVVVLLQPTSPLRTSQDIDAALRLFSERKAGAVVSVCEAEHHPLWANTLPEDGSMKDFIRSEIKGLNRQQLPPYYRLNGAIYISGIEALEKKKGFVHEGTIAYIMPAERSVDIDSETDLRLAELLLKKSSL